MSVSLLNQVLAADEAAFLTLLRGGEARQASTATERLAILILAWRANDDGTAPDWMTISRLSRESGLNRQNLHRVLKRLREAGIILDGLNLSLDALSLCATPTQPVQPVDNSAQPVDNSSKTVDNLSRSATVSRRATVAESDTPCRGERHKLSRRATPYRLDIETKTRARTREEAVHNSRPKVGDKGQGNRDYSQSGYAAANIAPGCTGDESAATVGKRQAQAEIILKALCFQCGVSDETAMAALPLALELALTSDPEEAAQNALAAVTAKNGPKIAPRGPAATTTPKTQENARKGR